MLYKKTKQPFDIADALSYHDAEFGEARTNGADKAAELVNQQVARPVQHQNSLLIVGIEFGAISSVTKLPHQAARSMI